jgi:beta-lactamase class A
MPPETTGVDRRQLISAVAGFAVLTPTLAGAETLRGLEAIEARTGGRLGLSVLDVHTGRRLSRRADERFRLCSTFKMVAVADVLHRVDARRDALDQVVSYTAADLLDYAPATRAHVAQGGMTLGALCAAAVQLSDNTAANLILARIGGPQGLTRWLRDIGDPVTRLDRTEPALNTGAPSDRRDTTTPAAMIATMHKILLGDVLSPASRQRLTDWLLGATTGASRLRAGLPSDWREGDKTGTWSDNGLGHSNDLAILWPPQGGPLLAAAFLNDATVSSAERDAALADVGRLIAKDFAGG